MIRILLLTAALATSCGPTAPGLTPMSPAMSLSPAAARVIPASSHVTGTYPVHCVRLVGADPRLPVQACTPGSIRSDEVNPTSAQLTATICRSGWTATIRPPESETDRAKTQAMIAYGIPPAQRGGVELDHLIPLSLGGSSDVSNLWPEVSDLPHAGFNNSKDGVEYRLHLAVCAGRAELNRAQSAIVTNWTTAEHVLGLR